MSTTTHYSARLRQQIEEAKAAHRADLEVIAELRRYLNSSKFYQDPTVQVRDVLTRLESIFISSAD